MTRVPQLLSWCAAGTGRPPYEDVPGLILRETPITEIITALQDPRADARHDAGAALRARVREAAAARGYELPQWAERLLLNA
ncbi:hypothetical protein ACWEIJ_03235 [Lentzea sp. NPDC004789]